MEAGWARGTGDGEAELEDADPIPAPTPTTKKQIGAESKSQPASSKHRTAVRGEGRGLLDGARRFPSHPADEKRPESGISKKMVHVSCRKMVPEEKKKGSQFEFVISVE